MKLFVCVLFFANVLLGGVDAQWLQLQKVAKDLTLLFSMRDATCVPAALKSVSEQTAVIVLNPLTTRERKTIQRADVVRVAASPGREDVLYSGRNSWSDVEFLPKCNCEDFRVLTKSGEQIAGKPKRVSNFEVTLSIHAKERLIRREDVAQLIYVRQKPLSEGTEYMLRELAYGAVFAPVFWQYLLRIGVDFPVKLYDASLPEDDRPFACTAWPIPQRGGY